MVRSTLLYPKAPNNTTLLYTINEQLLNSTDSILLDTLVGQIAKIDVPLVYRIGDSHYNQWLDKIRSDTNVTVDDKYSDDFYGLIDDLLITYCTEITGFAVYSDTLDVSLSHAITYCAGSTGVIAISQSSQSYYSLKYNIPVVFDATSDSLPDTLSFSDNIITFQEGSAQLFLIDYAVFVGSPFLSWDDPLRELMLSKLTPGSSTSFGWVGDEGSYVSKLSKHGVWAHASDWTKNLVSLSNIDVPVTIPSPTSKASNYQSDLNVHTVTFVLTDGDNLQWLLGSFFNTEWYGSSDRTNTPMSFTLSPALNNLSSTVLSYIYSESATNNSFVASPSGIGYIYPELLSDPALSQFVQLTLGSLRLLPNLRIINILAGCDDISDDILLRSSSMFLEDDQVDGIFYYTYGSGYAGGGGKSIWSETNKPIITARYSLWGENSDPNSSPMLSNDGMIQALQNQVKDATSASGYSVIPVHAWSHTVSDVNYIINNLGPGIDVLTADQFLKRFRDNVNH